MKAIKPLLLAALVIIASAASAQKLKETEGSFNALKGQSKVNVEFDYSDFNVGKLTEKDYLAKRTKELNEKEAGRGDKWKALWVSDRKNRYEPHFFEQFNKQSGLTGGSFPDAKYTIIVKVTRIEPGFNIPMVMQKNAENDTELILVETSNKGKALGKITATKAVGRTFGGNDWDTGIRIEESFELLGKTLGKYIAKLFGK